MSDQEDVIAQALADAAETQAVAAVDDTKINVVSTLAMRQVQLEARKKKLEEDLKTVSEDLRKVSEYDLPNALIEMGSRGFTLEDGSKIDVKKVYVASVKVENKYDAFTWMIDHGHEALIKTEVSLDVGKGEVELAQEIQKMITEFLKSKEKDLTPVIDQSVHWQTLRAFVKEQIEAEDQALRDGVVLDPDEVLPRELLGVHIIDKATITPPKKKK